MKRFGAFTAVAGIDVEVAPGEAFGFLGPNGAGKTSAMRMIGATSPISEGYLRVLGLDPEADGVELRARLGVVPQEDTLDQDLTVAENLYVFGRYFDLPRPVLRSRIDELLDFVQLSDRRNDKVDPLSGGMKRRLVIARSLINDPELVLLDEPTTGLDPQARHALWERLYQLKRRGVTLLLTTHYMDEAEQLCDRLVVMDQGHIVAQGSPRELIDRHVSREVLELRFIDGQQAPAIERLEQLDDDRRIDRLESLPDRLLVYTPDGDAAIDAVNELALDPLTLLTRRASLEDVFLRLTGRQLID